MNVFDTFSFVLRKQSTNIRLINNVIKAVIIPTAIPTDTLS